MPSELILADISKANPGSEFYLLKAVERAFNGNARSVTILLTEAQERFLTNLPKFKPIFLPLNPTAEQVFDEVSNILLGLPPDVQVEIISYHGPVLRLGDGMTHIKSTSWRVFVENSKLDEQPAKDSSGLDKPGSDVLSQGVHHLMDILTSYPSGLRKSSIRPLLAPKGDVFQIADTSFNITTLISRAKALGYVDFEEATANPLVFLRQASKPIISENNSVKNVGDHPALDPHNASATNNSATIKSDSDVSIPSNHFGQLKQPLHGVASENHNANPIALFKRMRIMLELGRLGPFNSLRDQLFDQIDLLAAESKWPAARLLKKAARNVSNDHVGSKKIPPFQAFEEFLVNLFAAETVLRGADDVILNPLSIETLQVPVITLTTDWRIAVESVMVYYLAKHLPDGLFLQDNDALSYALFSHIEDEDERLNRIDMILRYLDTKKAVRMFGKRVSCLRG